MRFLMQLTESVNFTDNKTYWRQNTNMSTSGNQGRLWAINEVTRRTPRVVETGSKVSEYFGCNTFNQKAMVERLPKQVYRSLIKTVKGGQIGRAHV